MKIVESEPPGDASIRNAVLTLAKSGSVRLWPNSTPVSKAARHPVQYICNMKSVFPHKRSPSWLLTFPFDLRHMSRWTSLPVITFDFGFVKTTSAGGETEQKYATTLVAVDADLFFVKAIPLLGKETAGYNKVKHVAGDLVKLETTPKHSSASNLAERAIQAFEEQVRTIRADCQMRFGNGVTFGADKPIWAWLSRQAA